ncbi:MAG: winged helix-turn-helix domain-containing protein [Nitrososphaerota archaeon]|uniref:winged helix-turn-helix domain-containing protein n=1 Tax=Candidatus Bathycorpusculum sp. TaxID=2994959 RepID=UPI0028230612|nr:winged helix-turn-helix domain-containing protein [Candidatus Termiticorpusculum sp.]MCL2257679.1 winged helix-turn-helix domain-containing protein [Candidatus Termiticorpusculum sp.]MCL2291901.1 winged helix-turn-helix domain-containing protein [Candidatus Termiticorpusculum sp.]MDR0461114.1 winged helix-turn-helix domain-containing protein [Nitrososphaerota archaeon]
MEFEKVFSSMPRMKILKLLYSLGQLNISDIARRTKMNFTTTDEHLRLLESEGIVKQYLYGRIRLYSFNEASEKARVIQKLIQIWEQNK